MSATTPLPKPIADYIAASNARRADTVAAYFAADAVVLDEGGELRGLDAIRAWKEATGAKYNPIMRVVAVAREGAAALVTAEVSGNFPGGPIELTYRFTLAGDRIARLEIDG